MMMSTGATHSEVGIVHAGETVWGGLGVSGGLPDAGVRTSASPKVGDTVTSLSRGAHAEALTVP